MTPIQAPGNRILNAGQELKAIRESKSVSLKDIFLVTRITTVNLEAIEEGRFHLLPEPVYARTFIKAYAGFLNIDHRPILDRYNQYLESLQTSVASGEGLEKQERDDQKPTRKRRLPIRTFILLIMMMALAVLYFIFPLDSTLVQSPPPQTAPVVKSPVVASITPAAPAIPVDSQVAPIRPEALPEKRYHLVIITTEKTWLRIREDQKSPEEMLLTRGDTMERFASDSFTLDIGNAGGVEISFQGKPLGRIGKNGQVVHLRLP